MITQEIINKTKDFINLQIESYQAPSVFQIDLANEKGQELAEYLKANKEIVLLGTLLMDCMLGLAIKEGKLSEHVKMSKERADEFLSQFPELDSGEKQNILYCVEQHHGAEKFYSPEAEVCCNADCYRFASVKGILGSMIFGRKMELKELVDLYSKKADEKYNALTIDICKKELEPQYNITKQFLSHFGA